MILKSFPNAMATKLLFNVSYKSCAFGPSIFQQEKCCMYAVVEIGGQQFKVAKGDEILTQKLPVKVGEKITFDRILMLIDGEAVKVGQPVVTGARIEATLAGEQRAPKVIVFKKKRRKGYRRTRGHRQSHSRVLVEQIIV
jgi:large subunit ribosomal protein L21